MGSSGRKLGEMAVKAPPPPPPPPPLRQLPPGPPPPKQLKAGPPPPKQLKAGPPPPKQLMAGPPPPKQLPAGVPAQPPTAGAPVQVTKPVKAPAPLPPPPTEPGFVVTPDGAAIPVPNGATGPVPVVNVGGKTTGFAFTGGKGGTNGKVAIVRVMDPTPAKAGGKIPAYPKGYVKYENSSGQGVDPQTGQTLPRNQSHKPL